MPVLRRHLLNQKISHRRRPSAKLQMLRHSRLLGPAAGIPRVPSVRLAPRAPARSASQRALIREHLDLMRLAKQTPHLETPALAVRLEAQAPTPTLAPSEPQAPAAPLGSPIRVPLARAQGLAQLRRRVHLASKVQPRTPVRSARALLCRRSPVRSDKVLLLRMPVHLVRPLLHQQLKMLVRSGLHSPLPLARLALLLRHPVLLVQHRAPLRLVPRRLPKAPAHSEVSHLHRLVLDHLDRHRPPLRSTLIQHSASSPLCSRLRTSSLIARTDCILRKVLSRARLERRSKRRRSLLARFLRPLRLQYFVKLTYVYINYKTVSSIIGTSFACTLCVRDRCRPFCRLACLPVAPPACLPGGPLRRRVWPSCVLAELIVE